MRFLVMASFVAVLSFVSPAHAQKADTQPGAAPAVASNLDLAREVVRASGSAETAQRILQGSREPFIANVQRGGSYNQADAERLWDLFMEEVEVELPVLIDGFARLYAETFTAEQLVDMRDFYTSPSGRALVAQLPDFAIAGQAAGYNMGAQAGTRAEQRFRAERAQGPT
jgi:hypothetical protein